MKRVLCLGLLGLALFGCSGGSQSQKQAPAKASHYLGGQVKGLHAGAKLGIKNSVSSERLQIDADGAFEFEQPVASGDRFRVLVEIPAPEHGCGVVAGSGAMGDKDFYDVAINCTYNGTGGSGGGGGGGDGGGGDSPVPLFSVGGTLTGLAAGATVQLLKNGSDALTLSSNGPFTFPSLLAANASYNVTVGGHPTGQTCSVGNPSGTITNANVTSVSVSCVNNTTPPTSGCGVNPKVTVNQTMASPGDTITATYSGASGKPAWIALTPVGYGENAYATYVSISACSGSISLKIPSNVLTVSHELRLYSDNTVSPAIARSGSIAITSGAVGCSDAPALSGPTSAQTDQVVTVNFTGAPNQSNQIIKLVPASSADSTSGPGALMSGCKGFVNILIGPSMVGPYQFRMFSSQTSATVLARYSISLTQTQLMGTISKTGGSLKPGGYVNYSFSNAPGLKDQTIAIAVKGDNVSNAPFWQYNVAKSGTGTINLYALWRPEPTNYVLRILSWEGGRWVLRGESAGFTIAPN